MKISIIIVTWNRVELLKKCLKSISKDLTKEIIVVLNGEDQRTRSFLETLPEIKTLFIKKTTPGDARNKALSLISGEYVLFLDDDIVLPEDYFNKAYQLIQKRPCADILGGPDAMGPWARGIEKLFSYAIESPFTTGHTVLRHLSDYKFPINGSEYNLILCNLWIKSSWFKKEKLKFDPTYFRNEENELIKRVFQAGGELVYSKDLFVYHHRKNEISKIIRTYFISGIHRGKLFLKLPQLFDLVFFIPLSFVLFSFFDSSSFLFGLSIYLGLSFLWLIIKIPLRDLPKAPFVLGIQLMILIAYSAGNLFGLVKEIKGKLFVRSLSHENEISLR